MRLLLMASLQCISESIRKHSILFVGWKFKNHRNEQHFFRVLFRQWYRLIFACNMLKYIKRDAKMTTACGIDNRKYVIIDSLNATEQTPSQQCSYHVVSAKNYVLCSSQHTEEEKKHSTNSNTLNHCPSKRHCKLHKICCASRAEHLFGVGCWPIFASALHLFIKRHTERGFGTTNRQADTKKVGTFAHKTKVEPNNDELSGIFHKC